MVKTLCCHYKGHGFNPWFWKEDLACCMAWPKKEKKRIVCVYVCVCDMNEYTYVHTRISLFCIY